MTLDITKPVQTRAGHAVVLDAERASGSDYPLRGRILGADIADNPQMWTKGGYFFISGRDEHPLDLVNVPETTAAECNAAAADGAWRFFRDETAKLIVASASHYWPTDDKVTCRRAIERADELVRQLRAAA